jgi:hypothetical protein
MGPEDEHHTGDASDGCGEPPGQFDDEDEDE